MKKFNLLLLAILGITTLHAAKIDQVIVRQQWPWSTDVKIEYKLSGVTAPVDIAVKAYNGDVELDQSKVASALIGDRYGISEDGVGTIVLDPVKAFGTEKVALANFKVKLSLSDSAANINEVIYKIFDLDSGKCTDVRRADFFDGKYGAFETDFKAIFPDFDQTLYSQPPEDVLIWTGVTNDVAYKTTKLVMRKVSAKDVVWRCGSPVGEYCRRPVDETNFVVKLTHDYYMGVFPLTQGQYNKIGGRYHNKYPESWKTREDADVIPVGGLMFGVEGSDGSASRAPYLLNAKMGLKTTDSSYFALATSAEWEYACRAGTTSALYNGHELSNDTNCKWQNQIAWTTKVSGGAPHPVGLLRPNSFGLYDMCGNMCECVSDFYGNSEAIIASFGPGYQDGDVIIDPEGPGDSGNGNHVTRGGYYDQWPALCRSAAKLQTNGKWTNNNTDGFRAKLVIPAED